MRVFVNVQALVSLDVDQVQEVLNQEITFDDNDATRAAVTQSGLVTLAGAEANTQFSFGGVTAASLLLVIAYQDVSLRLDDPAAPLIPVRTTPASPPTSVLSRFQREDQPGILLWRGKVSSLYLTNPNATVAASAFIAIVGNAT